MKLILLGPPGAGKGTLAQKLSEYFKIKHISTGQVIRESIANKTNIGLKVKSLVESGALVDDETMIALVEEYLNNPDVKDGYILDGFPRTLPQANAFSNLQNDFFVLSLEIDNEIIVKRLSGRRVHIKSGRTYHIQNFPPKVENKDDITGEDLTLREDDKPESIRKRLQVYDKETSPLLDYYKDKLVKLDATQSIEKVLETAKEKITNFVDRI